MYEDAHVRTFRNCVRVMQVCCTVTYQCTKIDNSLGMVRRSRLATQIAALLLSLQLLVQAVGADVCAASAFAVCADCNICPECRIEVNPCLRRIEDEVISHMPLGPNSFARTQ